ncbi:MAG: M10 family metallopeptidase C-terminal domain-containing protein, partial [Hyphomonadaceae bacterium]
MPRLDFALELGADVMREPLSKARGEALAAREHTGPLQAPQGPAVLAIDTIPGNVTTTNALTINGASATSEIDTAGDKDWYRVDLVAGESYVFTVISSDGPAVGIDDAFLEVFSQTGVRLSVDDDGHPNAGTDAQMHYTALYTGVHYLAAGGFEDSVGQYTISAETGAPQDPLDTLDLDFAFLDDVIDVYFATGGQQFGPSGQALRDFLPYEQQAVMNALQAIANTVNLTFVTTASAAAADFIISLTDLDPNTLGQAWPGSTLSYVEFAPDATGWNATGLQPGGRGFATIVHELGHALGLDHPHMDGQDEQVMQGVLDAFDSYGAFQLNQQVFTVMSYNDGWPLYNAFSQVEGVGNAGTPMALDIGALQLRYGQNLSYNTGDNIYSLSDGDTAYLAIWDAGGHDAIVHNGASNVTINLNAATLRSEVGGGGFVSYNMSRVGGYTIAAGVIIEDATGGSGADIITGNGVANLLQGNGGNDTILGMGGDDVIDGGDGQDNLNGGEGIDWVRFSSAGGAVNANLATGSAISSGGADTLTGFENIAGSAHNDTLTGNAAANTLTGEAGADTLNGGNGDDTLDGGAGDDVMSGGLGDDTYVVDSAGDQSIEAAAQGADTVRSSVSYTLGENLEHLILLAGATDGAGNGGANTITGNSSANALFGLAGDDALNGEAGDDTLDGGSGNDAMTGGLGNDTYFVDSAGDTVTESAAQGIDTVNALRTYVLTANVENLILLGSSGFQGTGNALANTLTGNASNNRLSGLAGNDTLIGNDGNDVLSGGDGNDTLQGGDGADTLDGELGNDAMAGGAGNDTYFVDSAGDVVSEAASQGTDTVNASRTYTLTANV